MFDHLDPSKDVPSLSDLQRDALMETFNIGMGRASRAIAELTKSDVAFSVPLFIEIDPDRVREVVTPTMFTSFDTCAVTRLVSGIDASVVMIFQGSSEAVDHVVRNNLIRTEQERHINPREVLATRMGHLVTESCLDQVESIMGQSVERAPVKFRPRIPVSVFDERYHPKAFASGKASREPLVILKIDLSIERQKIVAHLLFGLSHQAANLMAESLDRLVTESAEGGELSTE